MKYKNGMEVYFDVDGDTYSGFVYWAFGEYRIHTKDRVGAESGIYSEIEGFKHSYEMDYPEISNIRRTERFHPVEGDIILNSEGEKIGVVLDVLNNTVFIHDCCNYGDSSSYRLAFLRETGCKIEGLTNSKKRRLTKSEAEKEFGIEITS